jgi:hypothetical protein
VTVTRTIDLHSDEADVTNWRGVPVRMARSLFDIDAQRVQFAGHETFPLRYGWLKKSYDAIEAIGSDKPEETYAIFADDAAIARFGVGRNMVLSMKHWALATNVLVAVDVRGSRVPRIEPGPLGKLLFGSRADPFLEHPASLWLLHWQLAARPGRAAAWHWAFNEFHEPSFDRDLMSRRLLRRCQELKDAGRLPRERAISDVTIKRDVECLVRTYHAAAGGGRRAPEDSIESPLAELGLIQKAGLGELFSLRRGPKPSLPDEVFLFALTEFWTTLYSGRRSFSVDLLTYERGSPGLVFLLDEDSVAERLARLDDLTGGALSWDESSGMRQIYGPRLETIDRWRVLADLYSRDMELAA